MKYLKKALTLAILLSVVASCTNQPNKSNSQALSCFEETICNFGVRVDLFNKILQKEGFITDEKESYSDFYSMLDKDTISSVYLYDVSTKLKVKKIDFGSSFLAEVYACSRKMIIDVTLADPQIEFYREFVEMGDKGGLNHGELAIKIKRMSEVEFMSSSIKEVSIYYLGYYILINHFEKISYIEDVDCI